MTVSTFFSDADPETSSVDGETERSVASEIWDTIQAGVGTGLNSTRNRILVDLQASSTTDQYDVIRRGILLYDTSSLPDDDDIISADLDFVANEVIDNFSQTLDLVTSGPADDDALVAADHGTLGTVVQATGIAYGSLTVDTSDPYTFNTFTLNATGLGNISKTTATKFGLRTSGDRTDTEPTWVISTQASARISSADEDQAGDPRHKLIVTHSLISAGVGAFTLGVGQPLLIPTGVRPY